MTNRDELKELVDSLSDGEVGALIAIAQSGRKEQKDLVRLLELLRKQLGENTQSIKEQFLNLEVLRHQLKSMILSFLRGKDESSHIFRKISNHIHNESILYQKGLYSFAAKELSKAKTLAQNYEETGALIQVVLLEQHRILESSKKHLKRDIDKNATQLAELVSLFTEEVRSKIEYQKVFARYREKEKPFEELITEDDIPVSNQTPTFYTSLYAHLKDSLCHRIDGNFQKAYEVLLQAIELYKGKKTMVKADTNRYKVLLTNQAAYLITIGDFRQAEGTLNKMKSIPDHSFNGEAETFQNYYHLKVLILLNTLEFKDFPGIISEFQSLQSQYQAKINAARLFSIWYNIMVAYMIQEDFSQALKWMDKILLSKKDKVRQEIQYTTRVIELVIHFEHHNQLGMPAKIDALKVYLNRKNEKTAFKSAVLNTFRQLVTASSEKEVTDLLGQLAIQLKELEVEAKDRLGLQLLSAWAEARAMKVSVLSIFKLGENTK